MITLKPQKQVQGTRPVFVLIHLKFMINKIKL